MSYKEINSMRKEGNLSQALSMAESEFALQPDKHSATALFWCLNSLRKDIDTISQSQEVIDRMESLREKYAPDNDVLQKTVQIARAALSPEALAERKAWKVFKAAKEAQTLEMQKRLLLDYLRMDNPRPSLLHSLVLAEAIKIAKSRPEEFSIVSFTELWRLEHLRAEDWEKHDNKAGYKLPSTIEKLLSVLVKELVLAHVQPPHTISMLLDQALEQYPKNKHLIRYKAQFLALRGEKDEAIAIYKNLLTQQPGTPYLWDELSDMVDDSNTRTGMLCAAVSCSADENFLPKTRIKLANELFNLGLYGQAKCELDKASGTYARNNWSIPTSLTQLLSKIPSTVDAVDSRPVYARFRPFADDYLYSAAETVTLIKLKETRPQSGTGSDKIWQMRGQDGMVWVDPAKFRLDLRSPKGSIFKARMANGDVIAIAPSQLTPDLTWVRRVEGPLVIKNSANGKQFGFVESVFVTGTMLAGHENGEYVSLLAVLNPDNRWGAIVIY